MKLPGHGLVEKDGFRLRGLEMTRMEGFSDAVFAFAVTLLVVSLDVPKTYAELHASLRGFVPFAICFYFLLVIWYGHAKFFRRFGLHDVPTVALNGALLFVTLFYVYPLKFLFTVFAYGLWGSTDSFFERASQVTELMVLYGLGFTAVRLLMVALYWHGYRLREQLELSPLERALTRSYMVHHGLVAGVGLLSCVIVFLVPAHRSGLVGWVYLLVYPAVKLGDLYQRREIRRVGVHSPAAEANVDAV